MISQIKMASSLCCVEFIQFNRYSAFVQSFEVIETLPELLHCQCKEDIWASGNYSFFRVCSIHGHSNFCFFFLSFFFLKTEVASGKEDGIPSTPETYPKAIYRLSNQGQFGAQSAQ